MGSRISFEEGLEIFKHASLEDLKKEAIKVRNEKNSPNHVTFVLDTNPNYTNVCKVDCTFCAFYRKENHPEAYTKSVDEAMELLAFAQEAGLTTVLLQGGVNDALGLDYYVSLVKAARLNFPQINPHFFTAPELYNLTQISDVTLETVFETLFQAGQRSFPGGGAEIISERVRKKISPKKLENNAWIKSHRAAHKAGMVSTATMMYGHIEEAEDILAHLQAIRDLQDETNGFTAFIPWSYKRTNTALRRKVNSWAGEQAYFRILAFARLFLDNFNHIQASWFGEGKETGIESLSYGADDFGGTITDENVHRATDFINKTDHNGMLSMIRQAGFEPIQRNTFYDHLRTYEGIESVYVPPKGRVKEADRVSILQTV